MKLDCSSFSFETIKNQIPQLSKNHPVHNKHEPGLVIFGIKLSSGVCCIINVNFPLILQLTYSQEKFLLPNEPRIRFDYHSPKKNNCFQSPRFFSAVCLSVNYREKGYCLCSAVFFVGCCMFVCLFDSSHTI